MALTTRTITALMNGISRQPAILRSPDQTEDELNTWGRIASGLSRRPPLVTVAKLTGVTLGDATVHNINRDISERYTVIIDSGTVRVFDQATGLEKAVAAPLGWGYLSAEGPAYRAVTVADYTFIVNTEKVVALKGVGADQVAQAADLIFLGGTDPTGVDDGTFTDLARAGRRSQYAANNPGTLTGSVKRFDLLPDPVVPGTIYRVIGDAATSFVSYYVMGNAGGWWDETVQPGLKNALDELTMPHALIREPTGDFTFAPFSWKPRRVGDLETNPFPLFIGRTLSDVFFYQNRLGFLVDEATSFSGAGDFGDFFRKTILDYIDSDAFSVSATTTDVAILDYAVPFSDGIMLFSRQRQFALTSGDNGMSAQNVSIQPVTGYVTAPKVRPVPIGNQAHFASDANGGYVSIQEYQRMAGSNPTEAADITAHVPGLIPTGVTQLIPAADVDALFVITRDAVGANRSRMYAYQFFWDGDKKLQSAWRVWDFADGYPIAGSYQDGSLHLLMERPDGFFLEKMDLSPTALSTNHNRLIYLDRGVTASGTYNAGTNRTTFALPYVADPIQFRAVRSSAHATPDSLVNPTGYQVAGTVVSVAGDESALPLTFGHAYESNFTFSQQFPYDWQGRPMTSGRLQLHTFTVNYADTAYSRSIVYPYGDLMDDPPVSTEPLSDRVLGMVGATLGVPSFGSGAFQFAIGGEAKTSKISLVNDSPYGSTYVSAEWEGLFFNRALH